MFEDGGLPPQGPTRRRKIWIVMPYMDCSGVEVCCSEKHANEVAVLLANKVRGNVWIYEAISIVMAAPAESTIAAIPANES